MKLQLMEMDLYNRSNTHLRDAIEVNSFEEAVRVSLFNDGVTDEDVNQMVDTFTEMPDKFVCDGEELVIIFFKQ